MKKIFILICFITLTIILGSIAYASPKDVVWNEKTDSIIINAEEQTSWTTKQYVSQKYGFKMKYPSNWEVLELKDMNCIAFFNLEDEEDMQGVITHTVYIDGPTDAIITEEVIKETILPIIEDKGDKVLSFELTTLNNVPAAKLFYLTKEESNKKMVLITTIKDNRVYFIGGRDTIDDFPEFLETFNKMVDTFEFID